MLGTYPNATRPITAQPRRFVITQVFAVLAIAGVGAMSGTFTAQGRMALSAAGTCSLSFPLTAKSLGSMTSAGAGAFAPTLRATASATSSMQGTSTFGGVDNANRAVNFTGVGTFVAVSYAFFGDGERACVHQELRTAAVVLESRTAIVPFEDRVYRVADEPRDAGNQPRKRVC